MIRPKSCNRGLRSFPSIGTERFLSNGFDVKTRKARNPIFKSPIIVKKVLLKLESKVLL